MNPFEFQLEYPFGETLPAESVMQEVAPGVHWLRMGLPFALNHINLWLLEDEFEGVHGLQRGWTVIDCGIDNPATRAAWENVFTTQLEGLPIVRVIATHYHPDHVGLAHWLCQRWNAPLWMTAGEYGFARLHCAALAGADGDAMLQHFRRHGAGTPSMREQLQERRSHYARLVPSLPNSFTRLQDQRPVRIGRHSWRVITGCGHSPEHAALYCEPLGVLISGDMVLPRISTNVSVFSLEPEANPVQWYLESLEKFAELPAATLVLPSHGKPFRGLHGRIGQLQQHHTERLAEVVSACISPQSAADIVPVMFPRQLDGHQLAFALGEAIAHLHKLWLDGLLRRELGSDGIFRFQHAQGFAPD